VRPPAGKGGKKIYQGGGKKKRQTIGFGVIFFKGSLGWGERGGLKSLAERGATIEKFRSRQGPNGPGDKTGPLNDNKNEIFAAEESLLRGNGVNQGCCTVLTLLKN